MYHIAYAYRDGILKVTEEDAQQLTHINIAFGGVGADYRLTTDEVMHLERVEQIRSWNPQITIVLSVGGWGSGGFSPMAMTEAGRKIFAASCKEYLERTGLDGIDIDWEYPGIDWAGIEASEADQKNYTLLLKELRSAIGNKLLTVAVGAEDYFIQNSEMDQVAECCDYVQLMTYDLRNTGCYTAGHHTALYAGVGDTSGKNVDDSVKRFVAAGVPREKIVIGIAYYAVMWEGVPNTNHGLMQTARTDGHAGPGYAQLLENYVNQNGYVRYWDEQAKAPYLFNGETFLSYDDRESIQAKFDYACKQGLLGVMYWEHGLR